MTRYVLICGAGIAGCCAAIALARAGWTVSLIERQPAWQFQSSGIFVYGNGLAYFHALGLMDEMVAAGFPIPDGRNLYLDASGSLLFETRYPDRFSGLDVVPILGIRRAEMHRVLSGHLQGLGIEVRLDDTVEHLEHLRCGVAVRLASGGELRCDLLLGADGIRSGVRQLLWPQVRPRYSGFGVWRSVHRRPVDLVEKIMMMSPGLRLGIMPISHHQLYLFGTMAEPSDLRYPRDEWPALMHSRFRVFGEPARRFLAELDAGSEVLYTAVEEVFMPGPWHQGRVLLIGDAAHASTPFMGQGGAMAVQDAVMLADVLGGATDIDQALDHFSRLRPPICRFVQDASRQVGVGGAISDPAAHALAMGAMRRTAQVRVDEFYAHLEADGIHAT